MGKLTRHCYFLCTLTWMNYYPTAYHIYFGEQSWIYQPCGHTYLMLSSLVATEKWVHHNVYILNSTLLVIHLIWGKSYKDSNDTFLIIYDLWKNKAEDWTLPFKKYVNRKYHIFLKSGQLQMLNNCLIFYEPVVMNSKYLALIVIPQSWWNRLFGH